MSNYGPNWDAQVFDGQQITGPCSVAVEFRASARWKANNKEPVQAVGDRLLALYTPMINSFIDGQRIGQRSAGLPYYFKTLQLPGVTVRYLKQNGQESALIVVEPESFGGTIPTQQTIDSGNIIPVKYTFHGWPIPGYPNDAYLIVEGGVAGDYWWDFAGIPGSNVSSLPVMAQAEWPIADWRDISAGSTLLPQELKGDQYLEFEIVELPTDVPGPVTYTVHSGVAGQPDGYVVRDFPRQLNTWFTPQMGVIPETAVVMKGKTVQKTTPTLMGLHAKFGDTASVFAARMSLYDHPEHFSYSSPDTLNINYNDGSPQSGGPNWDGHTSLYLRPGDAIGYNNTLYMYLGEIVSGAEINSWQSDIAAQAAYYAKTSLISDVPGGGPNPTGTNMYGNSGPAAIEAGGGFWLYIGAVGTEALIMGGGLSGSRYSLDAGGNAYPPLVVGPGISIHYDGSGHEQGIPTPVPGSEITVVAGTKLDNDYLYKFGDLTFLQQSPQGYYCPVVRGAQAANDGGLVSVELGELKKGDIIMMATRVFKDFDKDQPPGLDYKATGLIWFGKNGKWYGKYEGQVPQATKLDKFDKDQYATVLDPLWNDDYTPKGPAKFYPCVSYRMGLVQVNIRLGTSLKYSPPPGFDAVTPAPPFTIPGPDVDDPSGNGGGGSSTGPHGDGVFN